MSQAEPSDRAVFDRLKSTGRVTHGLRRLITAKWNTCSVCDHIIFPGRPLFAGYSASGGPHVTGTCCADHLVELATPVYPQGTLQLSVDDRQPLWRYMDFAKFVAMLGQGGLYFPRADQLEDPFEGALGLARREEDWDAFYLERFRAIVATAPADFGGEAPVLTPDMIETDARRLLGDVKSMGRDARSRLVSCWHASGVESEALWRLYCPPQTLGVAIRTTAASLWDATTDDDSAVVGRVHYVDFARSFASRDQAIFCKRASLGHEREVRAVLANRPTPTAGRVMRCDLEALIHQVVLSPFSPGWFEGVVSDVIGRYTLDLSVKSSELLEPPFY